ncbi:MAG: TerC family protein [Deltaproteobacteria bacterium]|nr:TerC family protein [Deltaproteobacteria bacterium]MDQ3301536.1 TerC family protein [Myxococcota bacterium]
MLDLLSSPDAWMSFGMLAVLEVVLGVDNIIFIAILAGKLPVEQREKARKLGIAGAFVSRLGLLAMLSWIVQLDQPLFHIADKGFSGKALILFIGGLFLLYKATKEIHHKLEGDEHDASTGRAVVTLRGVLVQIVLLDMVFSIDSVITAVGMTPHVAIMVAANVVALVVMLLAGRRISEFVERHPSVKVLALSFLLMIGLVLVSEAFGVHVPKGYIYGAMGFSVFVEMINIRTTRKARAVHLNQVPRVSEIPGAR